MRNIHVAQCKYAVTFGKLIPPGVVSGSDSAPERCPMFFASPKTTANSW